jgi:hypothetical protein
MKNLMRVSRIIALAAVIGFLMAGCGGDDGEAFGTSGKLTITGLDSYNEQYVVALCNDSYLERSFLAAAGFNEGGTLFDAVKISGGQATLKVWEIKNKNALSYDGSDDLAFTVLIYDHTPVGYDYGFENSYVAQKSVTAEFSNGVGSGEIYVPSVQTNLSDSRFNGTFRSDNYGTWVFNGTNKAEYTSSSGNTFTREIKLENGRFWARLWSNSYSAWSDVGTYSFNDEGNILTIGYSTFTKQN